MYNKVQGDWMKWKDYKDKIEKEKIKFAIIQHNLECFKHDNHLSEFFFFTKEVYNKEVFYDINQNAYSLPLLFTSLIFPNAKTCFFVELFNFFQNLPINKGTTVINILCFLSFFTNYVLLRKKIFLF